MGDFEKAILNTFKAEGGYQNDIADPANYINGVLIGTNRGISAQGYYSFYKNIPTVQQMKDLTVEQAKTIFKGNYWDKVAGDYITNQSVAELMFQYDIGSGDGQLSDLKSLANKTAGKNVLVENDLRFTKMDAAFINGLDQAAFYANMKTWRFDFYDKIVAANIAKWEKENGRKITEPEAMKYTKKKFLQGWRNRLNTHVFV